MTLQIAGRAYELVTLTGHLFFNGEEVPAMIDHDARKISVSSLVSGEAREELIAGVAMQVFSRFPVSSEPPFQGLR